MNLARDCDCWRLTRVLEDEELPDHFCWEMLPDNVGQWFAQTGAGLAGIYWDEVHGMQPSAPTRGSAVGRGSDEDGGTAPVESSLVGMDSPAPLVPFQVNWPVRYGGRWLIMALRQWAQEDGSRTLANQLRDDPRWREEVGIYRLTYGLWLERCGGDEERAVDAWINDPQQVWSRLVAQPPNDEDPLAHRLRAAHIPDTPATLRHLRAVAVGREDPLPARGLLVTTLVFADVEDVEEPDRIVRHIRAHPNPEVSISGSSEHLTDPLLQRAGKVARAHRDWHRARFERSRFTEVSSIRKSQPKSFAASDDARDDRLDYLAEALRDADRIIATAGPSAFLLNRAIDKHLTRVYYRVRDRRQRAEVPSKPPPKWKEEARRLIRQRA